ncbi:uncharacterized protein LOC114261530 [Camellia sinensis]|uniref:uncharacterized protein LOC114261530 n=1 Tax=Camellia sinensis TaxID=4442 RepID=UPI00103562DB|nr:uncharacterized protein LOC114261530 [Camellia sinensis]
MACTLLSPLNLPTSSSSSSSSSINHCAIKTKTTTTTITATAAAAAANSRCWRRTSRRTATTVIAKASEKDGGEGDDSPAFNPFGFVTNNPSSKSAIQLPESPAEDGNVGQMLYRIEDKGKEFGSTIKSGQFRWFVRETGAPESRRGTIVFLHGAPTQSFSYRVVMSQMADSGFHCFAPDWIGFGFSDKPQAGYGFDYTEKEFHDEFGKLLDVLGVKSPFYLVVQGFLVGSYGLTWALKNPSRILKLAILNSPITDSSPVPGLFQKLRFPLLGEFTCQNAIEAERFIEAGSPYVLKLEKADVYRLPYLSSSGPGFALLEAAKRANFKGISSQIAAGFASGSWDKPILVAWGTEDKYLPSSVAEEFQKGNPTNVKLKLIEGAGHMPQEDWPEKVVDALRAFLL